MLCRLKSELHLVDVRLDIEGIRVDASYCALDNIGFQLGVNFKVAFWLLSQVVADEAQNVINEFGFDSFQSLVVFNRFGPSKDALFF